MMVGSNIAISHRTVTGVNSTVIPMELRIIASVYIPIFPNSIIIYTTPIEFISLCFSILFSSFFHRSDLVHRICAYKNKNCTKGLKLFCCFCQNINYFAFLLAYHTIKKWSPSTPITTIFALIRICISQIFTYFIIPP